MEQLPVTPFQLIAAVILLLAGAFSRELKELYARYRDSKDKESESRQKTELEKIKEKRTETEKVFSYYDDIVEEYARQLGNLRSLEVEVAQLRPLVLKVALQAQELQQAKEDKEDWKAYADRLTKQIESLGHIPQAFRRTPRDGDTGERMKRISQKMKTVREENGIHHTPATDEPPTIVSPSVSIKTDEVTIDKKEDES